MLPLAAVVTAGHVLETRAQEGTEASLFGRVFQMFPASGYVLLNFEYEMYLSLVLGEWLGNLSSYAGATNLAEHIAFAEIWAPRITSALALSTLALPFICKGASIALRRWDFTSIAALVDFAGRAANTGSKVVNISLMVFGLQAVLSVGSTPLIVTYSSFLCINALCFGARLVNSIAQRTQTCSTLST